MGNFRKCNIELSDSEITEIDRFLMDSFLHNHQSALDSQREDDAIRDLEDAGIYPDPDDKHYPMETDYDF